MNFRLQSDFKPMGDQPEAIEQLVQGVKNGNRSQVLQGVTGSGKTFTIANVIEQLGRPTLIMSHNKTLAAQLYSEFKSFFPDNAVEYFVSYYDYYQPEAYIATTNTYIEKDLSINEELEKLRLASASALLSGRRDVIIVSSVSCIYGIGNPEDFKNGTMYISIGQRLERNKFLLDLVDSLYSRNEIEFSRGKFRVKGDVIDIYPPYLDYAYRLIFWDDEVEAIETIEPTTGQRIDKRSDIVIYPAGNFLTNKNTLPRVLRQIQSDMFERCEEFRSLGLHLEAKRLEERVNNDLEMLQELGYCSGIENYSRYFDGRKPGTRPFCLIDYFPDDFLLVIDESHVTVPQIRAMYGGDRSRKEALVQYGFRLPSAFDNRPLKFDEFEQLHSETIYISATPANFEIEQSEGVIVEQVIRPTGLLDPLVEIRPAQTQIDDLLDEIEKVVGQEGRVLVVTIRKRMAEELSRYLTNLGIRNRYIHSDVDTLERVEIMQDLRAGVFDVLIGVNLLREGLDLPEVSLVAVLDADKEGFLRTDKSLIQTIGRAARNANGRAILYADKVTKAMQKAIDENEKNRKKQDEYNKKHNIIPKQINKKLHQNNITPTKNVLNDRPTQKPEVVLKEKSIKQLEELMYKAVEELDFNKAAEYRDAIFKLKETKK
ncbi:MAG: excinuclease ABC subunit UvrB [Bacteroidales bacterium]|jgi:excinuclease ABC subunit B|nr:excinuclease ABC subunit UvrB [Bacteroidales bacterium]MEE1112150.1 excinuclease ABC subunit UvrB [Bacteroidales bacterium]MEE1225785.1 excinuclease ABC subunit UvrB [Bacteroidales bacterium]